MEPARKVTDDIHILPSYFPIPGFGLVPVNAFVLKAREPVLVDTGLQMDHDAFIDAVQSVIDPQDLRWLWLTHPDADHLGALTTLMNDLPQLRLVTTFLGFGILMLTRDIALDRIYLLNSGESLDVGDRWLTAYKPPAFDNPATTGFLDSKSKVLFSSDFFGALVQSPSDEAEDYNREELLGGQRLWATIDAPWLHKVDQSKFAAELSGIRSMGPSRILSSHLPPANSLTETFLTNLASVPDSKPFVGPNQAALEEMIKQMTATAATAG
jgi:hypothetical protein